MENTMSCKPVYERIIFNRGDSSVRGYTFETEKDNAYTEHYIYKQDGEDTTKTLYDMFLYKNPGLKKILRFKLHNWGVQTLEGIIKKETELKDKFKETREQFMEKKEKLKSEFEEKVSEIEGKVQQKITEIKNTKLGGGSS